MLWRKHSLSSRRGWPARFSSVGIEGPKMSASRIPVRMPRRANASARLTDRKPVSSHKDSRQDCTTCNSRLANTPLGRAHGDNPVDTANTPLLRQAASTRKCRRSPRPRQTLQRPSQLVLTLIAEHKTYTRTNGLSWHSELSVENSRRCIACRCCRWKLHLQKDIPRCLSSCRNQSTVPGY